MILDIHTHNLSPDPTAVIDISSQVKDYPIPDLTGQYSDSQLFSVGIHPWWLTENFPEESISIIEQFAESPQVALIGEVGIDTVKGGPLFRQMLIFKRMVELSERLSKPLLIHDVKAHDIIAGLHKELNPSQTWIIHGFRSKPTVAEMFLRRKGIVLSFGQWFNPMTVHNIPSDRILAETDDSGLPVSEIIHHLSDTRGTDLTGIITRNSARVLDKGFVEAEFSAV